MIKLQIFKITNREAPFCNCLEFNYLKLEFVCVLSSEI